MDGLMTKATAKDIAALIGTSAASVSRVLSGDPTFKISAGLRLSIVQAAKNLGYSPPRSRVSVKEGRSSVGNLIAMVKRSSHTPLSDDGHLSMIKSGIVSRCAELRFSTIEVELDDLDEVVARHKPVGSIVIGGLTDDEMRNVVTPQIAVTVADWHEENGRLDCVYSDFKKSVRNLLRLYREIMPNDVFYVGCDCTNPSYGRSSNYTRFRTCDETLGGRLHSPSALSGLPKKATSFEVGYRIVQRILQSWRPPIALIFEDDNFAIGGHRALAEIHSTPCSDIVCLSLCETELGSFQSSAPVSIKGRGYEIGRTCVDELARHDGGRRVGREVLLSTEIVAR